MKALHASESPLASGVGIGAIELRHLFMPCLSAIWVLCGLLAASVKNVAKLEGASVAQTRPLKEAEALRASGWEEHASARARGCCWQYATKIQAA